MPVFEIHVHNHLDTLEILQELKSITKKLNTMSKELDDLKAKLVTSNEKIDIITTSTDGIKLDLASIKAKLEANAGGIDAAGVAELNTLVDAGNARLADAATALSDLDAETDPNA